IYARFSAVSLTNSRVSGNTSFGSGGGIWASRNVALSNSHVDSNNANGQLIPGGTFARGGGIYAESGSVSLTINSSLSNNTSKGDGGGSWAESFPVTLVNSHVDNNRSNFSTDSSNGTFGGNGGGIFALFSTVSLTNSTANGNISAAAGAGIFAEFTAV